MGLSNHFQLLQKQVEFATKRVTKSILKEETLNGATSSNSKQLIAAKTELSEC
jgi:hypothetical protein